MSSFNDKPSDLAIQVHSISKSYQINHLRSQPDDDDSHRRSKRWPWIRSPQKLRHETFWALRDVSFDVPRGQVLGVIGRNGAGKSTFLKILSRITEPTTGLAEISGRVGSLLEVGTGFHPELTGRENIYLNGTLLGMRRRQIDDIFDEIVAFAEVDRFIDTPVKRYSSGMYVRLAFAVAANLEPEVLIIDEVLSVGDAEFQKKCLGRMQSLGEKGRTVIFVSHNMDAVTTLCDRAIIFESGRIFFDGSASEAADTYFQLLSQQKKGDLEYIERGGTFPSTLRRVESRYVPNSMPKPQSNGSVEIFIEGILPLSAVASSKYLTLAIGVNQESGARIGTYLASQSDEPIQIVDGCFSYSFLISTLSLVPGKYYLDVSLINRGETLDSVQKCASFRVPPSEQQHFQISDPSWGPVRFSCVGYNCNPLPPRTS
ncbi:ABC transporter ATP-binding protein [Synechococcus sp. CS-1332]|uniref:ABC transporter ATP-binding protein n=1 Tax=Synechococcus sp. CS-1332 TaxID=2847972 RepID=UPI00223BB338|nr:ABC transporter ATP-binding protein [Synechococcus sp. CS-1332]MCT0209038.1 ABC transporter ATP-binding protein [Synechococcus sp. CS-1332]